MECDKYIGGRKLKKHGQTPQESAQIERRAILSIRSISESLNSIFDEISIYSPSMASPNASPIKHLTNSNTTFNYTPFKQLVLAPGFHEQEFRKKSQNNPELKPSKKKSISSVHYTTYMKPIGNMSQKLKGILEKQKEARKIEQEREINHINNLKQKANKQYKNITPKYQEYKQTMIAKEEAIAYRIQEKSESDMSGVTFQPKINKNIEVNQPFEQRMIQHEKAKQIRSTQIIKEVMKGQTYHPKINTHKQAESKIKSIWNSSKKNSSHNPLSKSFTSEASRLSEILNGFNSESAVKMKSTTEFDFINNK